MNNIIFCSKKVPSCRHKEPDMVLILTGELSFLSLTRHSAGEADQPDQAQPGTPADQVSRELSSSAGEEAGPHLEDQEVVLD